MGWQWHQLDHIQITCTSLQTNNHASVSSLNFLHTRCSFWCQTNSVNKAPNANLVQWKKKTQYWADILLQNFSVVYLLTKHILKTINTKGSHKHAHTYISMYTPQYRSLLTQHTVILWPIYRPTCVSQNNQDFVGASFTAHMPLLTANSTFGLGRRRVIYKISICITLLTVVEFPAAPARLRCCWFGTNMAC